jgi:SAM-dependent methyltransferase
VTSWTKPEELIRAWGESAPFWEKHRETVRRMFSPVTEALIEEIRAEQGQPVLDVAAGPGEPSLTLAKIADPGVVTCTDPVPEMIAASRCEARRLGLTNMNFAVCEAGSLPFANESFEVVTCRFGAMFFPEPERALGSMLRVSRPGARLSLAVWGDRELNPFFHIIADPLARYFDPDAGDPDAPGAFRFAAPDKLAGILAAAGADRVRERTLDFILEAPVRFGDYWGLRTELSDTLREKLSKLTEEQIDDIRREVELSAADYFTTGSMRFPARVIIVTGERPVRQK